MRTDDVSRAPQHDSEGYEFFLFGRFVIRTGHQESLGPHGRRAQELLAYLILSPERPHHREALAETLWGGEAYGPEPRKQMRQALWQLRLEFRHRPQARPFLLVDGEWLQVTREAWTWADVWELEQGFSSTKGLPGEALTEEQAHQLRLAVDLCGADLLEGWYGDWCVYERERLRTVYLSMLDKLLAHCERQDLPEDGLLYGERILAHDRAHERTHRRMMRLHLLAGDRTSALRQFDRCAAALREELGIQPSEPVVALFEDIRADSVSDLR